MRISSISRILFLSFMLTLPACQSVAASPTYPIPATYTSTPVVIPSPTITPSPTATLIPTAALVPVTDFIKGAWFVDWGLGPGVATLDGTQVLKDIIVPLGANWIALTAWCRMKAQDPSMIKCNPDDSLSNIDIVHVTKTAHSLGLRVALFAFVLDVEGVPDNWSANLDYGNNQDKWNIYFDSYTKQLIPLATLSEKNDIDLLIIGGEQTGAQKQEAHWRSMIEKVRAVYHGPITYEAWCDSSASVKWWDAVDYIGINFYCFPLSTSNNPSDKEVQQNYLKFLKMVKDQTAGWNKQIIFTEIGYESIHGVAQVVPFGLTPVRLDVEEQGILVKNFFEALKQFGNDDQWLKGMFWYNFTSSPSLGGMGDLNFTPHNKPAEVYIRAFYAGQEPGSLPTLPIQADENKLKASYWIFSDKLENGVSFGPWDGNGQEEIVDDPLQNRGRVVKVDILNQWDGVEFSLASEIDFRKYDLIEMYLYVPKTEPNLDLRFSSKSEEIIPFVYPRSFMDYEPLVDGKWHRISIPIDIIFPENRPDKNSRIAALYLMHMWPGEANSLTFYLDDIRLVKLSK